MNSRQLNRRSPIKRWLERLTRDHEPQIDNAGAEWQVEFRADPDGDMNEGDLLIDSELVLPAKPDLGVGERTRRITTIHTGASDHDERAHGESRTAGGAIAGARASRL